MRLFGVKGVEIHNRHRNDSTPQAFRTDLSQNLMDDSDAVQFVPVTNGLQVKRFPRFRAVD